MRRKILKELGLSNLETKIYGFLSDGRRRTAKEIAINVSLRVEAVYRPLRSLVAKGLIVSTGRHPAFFQPLPIEVGINNILQRFNEIATKLTLSRIIAPTLLPFQVIPNRKAYHQIGKKMFKQVKKEVLVIASGTGELPPEFIRTKFKAVKKGIEYKILALTLKDFNKEKLKSWQKIGFKVRHKKGKGVNFVIYDRKIIQIGLRLEEESREKIGLIIDSQTLAEFLGEFYNYLWQHSVKI